MSAPPAAGARSPRGLLLAGTVLAGLGLLVAVGRLLIGVVADTLGPVLPGGVGGMVAPLVVQAVLLIGLEAVAVLLLGRSVPTRTGADRRAWIPLAVLLAHAGLDVVLPLAQGVLAALSPDRAWGAWASVATAVSTLGTAIALGLVAAWCLLALATAGPATARPAPADSPVVPDPAAADVRRPGSAGLTLGLVAVLVLGAALVPLIPALAGAGARLLPGAPPGIWFAATFVVSAERSAVAGAVLLLAGLLTVRGDRPLRAAAWAALGLLWVAELVALGAFAVQVLVPPDLQDARSVLQAATWVGLGATLLLCALAAAALLLALVLSGARRPATLAGTTPAAPSAAPLRPGAGPRG